MRGDGDADAARGVGDALARQAVVGDREALVHLAEHLMVGHPAVLELEFGGVVRGAQRVHDTTDMEARRVGIDDEAGDAGAALRGVGAGKDDAVLRAVGIGDKDLGAVQHPAIVLAFGLGLDGARRVAAARRFGEAEERLLLAAQGRIEIALLLVVVGLEDLRQARTAERAVAGHVEAGAVLRHLDGEQGAGHDVDVRAAELLGNVDPEQAHRLGLLDQPRMVLRRQFRGIGVELGLERNDLLPHIAPDLVDQHLLLGVRFEIHLLASRQIMFLSPFRGRG